MQIVLYITGSGVAVYRSRRWHEQCQTLAWEQVPTFMQQLAPSTRLSLVLDLLEEDWQADFMPVLFPWEKQALQKRNAQKMQQKGVLLHHSLWSGIKSVNEDGRKEEMLITASISGSKPLKALMDQIQTLNLIITGIYSAPFLLKQWLFTQLKSTLKWSRKTLKQPLMLIVRMSERNYRQCFFYQGQLRLTRIIELESGLQINDSQQVLRFLAQEAKLASRFIYNQKILPQGTAFAYLLVDRFDDISVAQCEAIFADAGALAFQNKSCDQCFYLLDLAHTGLKPDRFVSQHLVKMARNAGFSQFYTTPYVEKVAHYRRAGLLFNVLTLLTIALIGFFILKVWLSTLNEDIQSVQYQLQQNQILQAKLIEERQNELLVNDIEGLIAFAQTAQAMREQPSYLPLLQGTAQALTPFERIHLQSLYWQAQEPLNNTLYTLRLTGVIYPFDGHYQQVLDLMEAVLNALRAQRGFYQVTLQQKPLDIDDSQGLSVRPLAEIRWLPFTIEVKYDADAVAQAQGGRDER